MNKIHKLVWSTAQQGWVAASEVASAVGARRGSIARRLRRLAALTLAMSGAAMAQTAPAPTTLPQGGHVVQGQATLQGAGTSSAPVLNVNQSSQRAVVDWQSFNLGSAATVNFNQPNAQSATLNRVQDVNPSRIFGHINAPGQVTLMNPNGVYFSPSAVLDVGALTATTMQQSDADFMAGKSSFTRNGSSGSVVNEGTLQARLGGYIALLAPEVRNEGLIVAQQGTVALASGEAVQLNFDAASRLTSLTVTPSQIAALVENRTAVQVGEGRILLSATAVSGLQGSVVNSGTLSANSLVSKGGRIVLEGDAITLGGASTIDATGATGGGTVLVGGDWQGAASTHQATTVTMAQGTTIDASAITQGDGGKVVLWSDVHDAASSTTAHGSIKAQGGRAGGNGGQIETSGHAVAIDGLAVDAGASSTGSGGLWLIDPADATITQGVADSYRTTLNTGTSVLNDVAGNITWNSGVSLAKTAGGDATLTLRAVSSGSISLSNASITSTSGGLNLVLWTRYNNEGTEGRISLSGSTVNTNGGSVWMGGGNTAGSLWSGLTVGQTGAATWGTDQQGVNLTGSSITTGAGGIQIKGLSYATGSNTGTSNYGVWINAGSSLNTTSGSIDLQGDVKGTYTNGLGVLVGTRSTAGNVTLASGSGAINITGTATDQSGSGTGWRHGEMLVANNAGDQISVRSTSGAITLNGTANSTSASFTTDSSGVQLQENTTTGNINVVSQTGAISLLGSAALEGTNQSVDAIRLSAADVASSIRIGYDGIHPYSGNILLQGDSILQLNNNAGAGSLAVQTSGTLTMQSAGSAFTYLRAGSSGTLTFDDDWNFGSTLSGLTIGKTTNTLGLSLSNPLTVAGSVDITAGSIALNANLSKTSGGDATLTMRSMGDIVFSGAGINATSGKLNTVLISDWDSVNGGAIYLNGSNTALTINTNGGQFWAGGNGYAAAYGSATWNGLTVGAGSANSSGPTSVFEGVNLNRVALNTGGGNVSITGRNARYNSAENRYGVLIQNGSSINSGSGSIAVNGSLVAQSGSLATQPVIYGVAVANSILQATTGGISLSGSEGASDVNFNIGGYGIQLYNSAVKTTGSSGGNITLAGTTGTDPGGSSTTPRYGVQLFADGASQTTEVSSVAGNIAITGTANVSGSNSTSAGLQFTTRQSSNADTSNPVVKVVSRTGNVTLTGDSPNNPNTGSSGIGFDGTNYGKLFVGFDGTNAYSGTTTLTGRGVTQANMAPGYLFLGGSGALVIEPLGNSFVTGASTPQGLNFDTIWSFGSNHASIRFGKDIGSTAHGDSITIGNALGAAGPISLYSGTINLNANLGSTAAGAGIVAKASGNIVAASGEVMQTNGGAITLWADSDGSGAGYIDLVNNNTLDSRTAAARTANAEATSLTSASGGGNITLAGGSGATAADGYAVSAGSTGLGGVNLGDQNNTNSVATLYSGGGDVLIRGRQSGSSAMAVQWINGGVLNAGQGTVRIEGLNQGSGHGIELAAFRQSGEVRILAGGGNATAAAIDLRGTGAATGNGIQATVAKLYSEGAGGISIAGTAGASGNWGVLASIGLDAQALSGPITINAGSAGISTAGSIAALVGSPVAASSSDVTLTADRVQLSGGFAVRTTGKLTVQPWSQSFSSALNWPPANLVALAPTLGGLTLGKDGNTADITLSSAANIAGPISLYGGNVNLNADLVSSLAGAPILVKASGNITSNASRSFQTNNGDLIFWSNAGNGGTAGAQSFGDANSFNTANGSTSQGSGGGRIVMAGGLDDGSNGGTAGDGTPDGAAASSSLSGITLATASTTGTTSLTSGGGSIVLRGTSTASGAAGIGLNKAGTVAAGNGTVSLSGNASQGHGIELGAYGGTTSITAGGGDATHAAISLVGTTTSSGTSYSGVQTSGGTMQATGAGGIGVTGSATGSTYVNGATNLGMDVLAASGPIAITAIGNAGLRYGGTLGKKASTGVTASSANVTLTADALTLNGNLTADTSGSLTVQPYSASFGSALAWGTGVAVTPTVSALTLGKTGNTAAITVATAQSVAGPINMYGGAVTVNQNLASSASGDITLFADTLAFGANGRLASAGNLNIATTTAGRTIGLGGGSGLLSLAGSFFTTNFVDGFAGITIGNTSSGAITAGSLTASDALTLRNGSAGIAITGALNTGANTLTLASSGSVVETGAGAIVAANLALLGGNVALNGASNDVGSVAGSGLGTLSYVDSNALTIGTVGATVGLSGSGTLSVATATGDLTLAQSVVTGDSSDSAVVLNAGQAAAAGTATGGDLKISGNPAVITGAGGRATLYTGSLTGSTGLSDFIGSGSGRFRYDSDETTSHYSAALAAAAFAVYREQPTLTITPASSTITYGDALPALTTASSGAVNGDVLAVSASVGGGTSTSGHAVAGSHAISGSSADATALGYAVSSTAATVTVTPKALTISGLVANSKVYDGSAAASVDSSGAVYAGLVSGDVVTVSATGSFADKNVGTAKAVTLTSNHSGADAGNYSVTDQASSSADISAKALTVSGSSAASKVYDGNTTAAVSGGSLVGVVGGDAVTLAEAGQFATANAGTAIAVTASDSLGGTGAGNYTLAQPTGLVADITPKALTVSGSVVDNKVYDRTTSATLSGGTLQGVVAGDSVALVQAGDFATANAGPAIAVTASDALIGAAGNYTLVQPTGLIADITPKALTVSGSSAASKVYDRTTTARLSGGTLQGVVAGDNVTLTEAGDFASANAGTAIAVTASDALVGGNGNYTLVQPIGLAADITPKTVTVTGSVAASKVYDGNTTASISGGALQGVIAGDTLSLNQAGTFASANAGTAISVTIGDTLNGAAAGNYLLTPPATLVADISPKPLTLQGATGVDKTYDGRSDLHATGYDPLTGVVAGDNVAVQGAPIYASANAGQQAIVQGSVALGGASAGNYTLGWVDGSGTITPAALTVTANNDARFVTQADGAGYNGVGYSGFVNGETAAVLGGTLAINRSNAATNAAGAYAGVLVPSGATAANYSIRFVPGSYTIVPANQLLVKIANTQTTYGNEAPYAVTEAKYLAADNSTIVDLTGSTVTQGSLVTVNDGAGGVARFTIAPVNAALSGAGALKAGSYQLAAGAVTGSSANFGNQLVVVGAQQVDAKGITLATSGATKVYDGTTTVSGLQLGAAGLASDALSASGQGSFSSRNVGTGLAYSVTGLQLDGADAGNYFLAGGSTQAANDGAITPRFITLTAPSVSRVYDGSAVYVADASVLSTLGQGLVPGDALNGLSLVFDDKNVGTGKTLTTSGAQIADGNNGANYLVRYVADHASSITRLDSVTWVGGATGSWFDPANWAGGAVPDLANVANVVIPANVTVSFGLPGAVAPVQIESLASGGLALQAGELDVGAGGVQLASLSQSGGSLNSQGNVALGSFTQSGGALATAGNFSTSEAFGQTGAEGSVTVGGDAHIVNTSGPTWLGNLSSGSLSVTSSDGAITQQAGTALAVQGSSSFSAANANGTPADITLDAVGNRLTGPVSASGADVNIVNGGPLSLSQVTATGDLSLQSQGALDLGRSQVGGSLTANSHGGNVSQSGPVIVGGRTRIDAGAGSVQLMLAGNRFGGGLQVVGTGAANVFDASSAAAAAGSATQAAGATQVGLSARAEAAERAAPAHAQPASVIQLQPISVDSAGLAQVQLSPAPSGTGFTFALPAPSAQALRDGASNVIAQLADGSPLPDWLMFDAERLSFTAVAVPPGGLPIEVLVRAGAARLRVQVDR